MNGSQSLTLPRLNWTHFYPSCREIDLRSWTHWRTWRFDKFKSAASMTHLWGLQFLCNTTPKSYFHHSNQNIQTWSILFPFFWLLHCSPWQALSSSPFTLDCLHFHFPQFENINFQVHRLRLSVSGRYFSHVAPNTQSKRTNVSIKFLLSLLTGVRRWNAYNTHTQRDYLAVLKQAAVCVTPSNEWIIFGERPFFETNRPRKGAN